MSQFVKISLEIDSLQKASHLYVDECFSTSTCIWRRQSLCSRGCLLLPLGYALTCFGAAVPEEWAESVECFLGKERGSL